MSYADELLARMNGILLRTMQTSPTVADAMGRAFHERVTRVTLQRYSHPGGMFTPSPPGQPPGSVSGELARSITTQVKGGVSTSRAWVGPHTIYAAVQEFGRVIDVQHTMITRTGREIPGFMRWEMEGQVWYKRRVFVPERSYMRRTRDDMIADGSLHRVAVRAFLAAEGF